MLSSDEAIRFRTRKHFALLIRLAVEPGKLFTRDYLADLLWPDAPQRLAAHSLAQAISAIKERIGSDPMSTRRATIGLSEGLLDADVQHLDACDAEIRGPFLDGFEIPDARGFEDWKDEWRAKLTPKMRDCLVRQMDAGRRVGDFARVEQHAQVLHDIDALSEDAVRGLMEARAWAGDRSSALKAYARFEHRLAEELGAKPSADLARMADLLREGRARAAPPPSGPGAVSEPGPSLRAEKRFESETLIGREKEFAALYDAWLDVRRRAPRVVVLTGDPGVGKTTLTNAFLSSCQLEGAVVARAQAYDAERELPYAILGELVRQLAVQRAIGAADPEALSELSRVTPDIFALFPGVPRPVEWSPEVTPLRLADAFLKTMMAAAEESPLVLVVDDVHAADSASAGILHMVARKLAGTRALVILAGRAAELRTTDAPAALTSDATIEGLRAVELNPLSDEAAAELVARLASRSVARSDRVREPSALAEPSLPTQRILRAASGNPLALELLTREWSEQGPESLLKDLEALDTMPAATLGIPRAIRTVFERQVRRLDARTRAVLDLAAVLGRRLSDLSLYAAVDCPPGEAAEALSRLLDERFLREVHGDLEFRNELIRAQAYYGVAGKVRQQLHRRVAEELGRRGTDDENAPDLEIAWHYLRGGDVPHGLSFGVRGAEFAVRTGAPSEAEHVLRQLVGTEHAGAVGRRIRLTLATALVDQSKGAAAIPVLTQLFSDGSLGSRENAEAACIAAAAEYLVQSGPDTRYSAAAESALAAAQRTGDAELLAKALFHYAQSGAESGNEQRLRDAAERIDILLATPPTSDTASAYYARAFCHFMLDDIVKSVAALRAAVSLSAERNNPVELSRLYNALGVSEGFRCAFGAAGQAFDEALRLARHVGDDARACLVLSNRSAMLVLEGHFNRAIELASHSIDLGTRALSRAPLVSAYLNLSEAYVLLGRKDEALRCLAEAQVRLGHNPTWRQRTNFLYDSASKMLALGNVSLALSLLSEAEAVCQGKATGTCEPSLPAKLRVLRAAHSEGPETALSLAQDAATRFRDRSPLAYLTALACKAWAERLIHGTPTAATENELLPMFDTLGVHGRRALLRAQGFLQ